MMTTLRVIERATQYSNGVTVVYVYSPASVGMIRDELVTWYHFDQT